ncbi:MAG TPA: hypothetical protein VGL73_09290 [Caulobacteraceae bacterium]
MNRKLALGIGLALLTSGCLGSADTKKADDATTQFYQQMAAKQYQAIYDGAAPELKNSTSAADFIALMQRIDDNMGACQPPVKRLDIHTKANPDGFLRDQGYTQTCANGKLNETVTIVLRNGAAKLAGYRFATPPASSDSGDSSN